MSHSGGGQSERRSACDVSIAPRTISTRRRHEADPRCPNSFEFFAQVPLRSRFPTSQLIEIFRYIQITVIRRRDDGGQLPIGSRAKPEQDPGLIGLTFRTLLTDASTRSADHGTTIL